MKPRRRRILLLALGNDILGDDAAGLVAAEALRGDFEDHIDVVASGEAGLALLDILAGYESALLVDSISTGRHPPGTVLEYTSEDFHKVVGPSPHYAGLPEVLELARRLDIEFPREVRVLALEIAPPMDFRETLSPAIQKVMGPFVDRAGTILREWLAAPPQPRRTRSL